MSWLSFNMAGGWRERRSFVRKQGEGRSLVRTCPTGSLRHIDMFRFNWNCTKKPQERLAFFLQFFPSHSLPKPWRRFFLHLAISLLCNRKNVELRVYSVEVPCWLPTMIRRRSGQLCFFLQMLTCRQAERKLFCCNLLLGWITSRPTSLLRFHLVATKILLPNECLLP